MSGSGIEETFELWSASLRDAKARLRPLFDRDSTGESACHFLDGLLGEDPRKTGWMRGESAGDKGPWRQQALLDRRIWNADDLRDVVREYALETLSDEDGVLVIDETGFPKKGVKSCGVSRQYTGTVGKVDNCQIGVFACYASRHGHALIDRALYLPKVWTDDAPRMRAAHVPDGISFATKPALALAIIQRAIDANVPFAFVAADSVYGTYDVEMALRRANKGYVLGVSSDHHLHGGEIKGMAKTIAKGLSDTAWQRLSCGEGSKGDRLHDWAYVEIFDLDGKEIFNRFQGHWTKGLLIRRNIADNELAFYITWCPLGTSIETLICVAGRRWAIEESFETAKTDLGLDHNETRSWHGWHRHVSLVMLAFTMVVTIRYHANNTTATPKKMLMEGKLQSRNHF